MDNDTKRFLGKILGELYRTQRMISGQTAADAHIYGLTHGFETAIDHELERIGWVSADQEQAVGDVLDPIFSNRDELDKFRGFYDVEDKLAQRGVNRGQAARILTKMKADGQFETVIDKMDSGHSPLECKRFDIRTDD